MSNKLIQFAIVSIFNLVLITGCGGGGSASTPSSPDTPSPPTPPPPTGQPLDERINMISPTLVTTNQPVGLVAMVTNGAEIVKSKWVQTAGPSTGFLAGNSQVIGFDVKEVGDYRFTYTGTDSGGNTTEQEVTFVAEESDSSTTAQIRLDHAVTERGKVSLRADSSNPQVRFALTWRQISGPTIPTSALTPQDNFLFFNAPSVTKDELLQFEAVLTFEDGTQDTDAVYVLVKNTEINSSGFFPDAASRIVSEDVYAFNAQGQYANVLVGCVYNNLINESCTFGNLPIIAQSATNPTIDDIMDRVVVSHDWMAERFRQYLETSPVSADMIRLLKAVTAIVIAVNVRPSFYWAATGAIYLDPDKFWITPQERDTLNDAPDFRSSFGGELQFIMPWRYVKDGENYLRELTTLKNNA